jgi:MoaA/NifB/PqqE/SkfB family radical SAM enzyme
MRYGRDGIVAEMEERYTGLIRHPGVIARLGIRSYPISLTFELTWLCNLACLYCDRHTPMRHEMSREEIFSALDQAYARAKAQIGRAAEEGRDYRQALIETGTAPFRCRAGARFLYVDAFGMVRWCAQTRSAWGKDLLQYGLDDLREQFYAGKPCSARCSVGCVRTASAYDQWRAQSPA